MGAAALRPARVEPALTDHGNLFGAVDFYTACEKAGVKPILGAELIIAPSIKTEGKVFQRAQKLGRCA